MLGSKITFFSIFQNLDFNAKSQIFLEFTLPELDSTPFSGLYLVVGEPVCVELHHGVVHGLTQQVQQVGETMPEKMDGLNLQVSLHHISSSILLYVWWKPRRCRVQVSPIITTVTLFLIRKILFVIKGHPQLL